MADAPKVRVQKSSLGSLMAGDPKPDQNRLKQAQPTKTEIDEDTRKQVLLGEQRARREAQAALANEYAAFQESHKGVLKSVQEDLYVLQKFFREKKDLPNGARLKVRQRIRALTTCANALLRAVRANMSPEDFDDTPVQVQRVLRPEAPIEGGGEVNRKVNPVGLFTVNSAAAKKGD